MTEKWPDWLPLRSELRDRLPYGAPQVESVARLNTNENPYPLPKEVGAAILRSVEKELDHLNRYPDRDALALRQALADYVNTHLISTSAKPAIGVTDANVWPANGSNEVLQSILLAFGESVAGFSPSYSMHPILSEAVGKSFKPVPLRADFTPDLSVLRGFLESKKPSIFFLTTPNNPTGRSIEVTEIRAIAQMVSAYGGLLIVDEAYGEFSNRPSAIDLIAEFPSIVVVRTMSKAFAFAGARVGYAVARAEVIDAIQLVRLPYHLSAITQAAAIAAIAESEHLLAEVDRIKADRDRLAASLVELGLKVIPSEANFLLFGGFASLPAMKDWESQRLWRALVDRGVLVRDVGIPGWLRVTIGSTTENSLLLDSLRLLVAG